MLKQPHCNIDFWRNPSFRDLWLARRRRKERAVSADRQTELSYNVFLDSTVIAFETEFSPFLLEQDEVDALRGSIEDAVHRLDPRVKMLNSDDKVISFALIRYSLYINMIRDEVMKTPLYQRLQAENRRLKEMPE